MLNRFLGDAKPKKELAKIWTLIQPFLFGSIGAAIKIKDLNFSLIPLALVILICGIISRMIGSY